MLEPDQRRRLNKLLRDHTHNTYNTDFFSHLGLHDFIVYEGVVRPEVSLAGTHMAQYLFENPAVYRGKMACEIGCGSGLYSVLMAKYGAEHVVATDISEAAVMNTAENAKLHNTRKNLEVRKGDLFEPVNTGEYFDVIVFHHPHFHDRPLKDHPVAPSFMDHGRVLRRFMLEAPVHLRPGGRIIMPFSHIAGRGNDPGAHGSNYGMGVNVLRHLIDNEGDHSIYELVPKKGFDAHKYSISKRVSRYPVESIFSP